MSDPLAGAQFLQWLCGDEAPGWLTIFSLPGEHTEWFPAHALEEAAAYAVRRSQTHDVYLGVGLRGERRFKGRGEAKDVVALPALYADIDLKHPVHKATNLPESIEEARRLLTAIALSSSLLIHSGHGLQPWWLLQELWHLNSDEQRQEASRLNERLQQTIKRMAHTYDWHLDGTADLDRRYNPSDFAPYLIEFNPTTNGNAGLVHLPADLPHIDFRMLDVSYRIKSLILDGEDRVNPEKSPSRSEPLFGVLRALVSKGYGDSTIASVLLNPAYKISEKPLERGRLWLEQEIRRIRVKPAPAQPIDDAAAISTLQHNNHDPQEINYESDPAGDTHETISRLAALSPIAYDRAREAEAQALRSRVSTLDWCIRQPSIRIWTI